MSEPKKTTEAILQEADRIEEDCLYSGKSLLNSADVWNWVHYGLGIPAVILGALAAADITNISELCAAAATLLVAISTFSNPSQKSSERSVAGNGYLALCKRVRRFREIDMLIEDQGIAREQLEALAEERDALNEGTPNPLSWGFNKARTGIEEGEAEYRVDKGEA